MNVEDLYRSFKGNILIIGHPASGKTTIAKKMHEFNPGHTLIHTDQYLPYKEGLYDLLDHLKNINGPTLIEGVNGTRLLRKGVQTRSYYPDYVINVMTKPENIRKTYENERDPEKYRY